MVIAVVAVPIVAAIPLGYLRFTAVPVADLPAAINEYPSNIGVLSAAPDQRFTTLARRAALDHFVNPLPEFGRLVVFTQVLTTPKVPEEVFLRFDYSPPMHLALAYRCTTDGRLLSKGQLNVSP